MLWLPLLNTAVALPQKHFHLLSAPHFDVVHVELNSGYHQGGRLSQFALNIGESTLKANVRLHKELFADNYFEERRSYKDGIAVNIKVRKEDSRNCIHIGGLEAANGSALSGSWVVVSDCDRGQLTGTVRHGSKVFSLGPAHEYLANEALSSHYQRLHQQLGREPNPHVIYELKDYGNFSKGECGVKHVHEESIDHRRLASTYTRKFHPTASTKIVRLLLVNDHKRYTLYGSNTEKDAALVAAHTALLYNDPSNQLGNNVATVLNPPVSIILVAQITWATSDPFTPVMNSGAVDVDSMLSLFNSWRVSPGETPDHNNGHLLSGYEFSGATVGYAGVFTMCEQERSGGIEQTIVKGFSPPTIVTPEYSGAVLAHEMGHNWGMNHDTGSASCPISGYIMNAALGNVPPTQFSSCSLASYNQFIGSSLDNCLSTVPASRYGDPVCGNGFIETGEECDCGTGNSSCLSCCDSNCRLLPGALCSPPAPCCTPTCGFAPASSQTLCRASNGVCDVAETCSGTSGDCPPDGYVGAGTPCVDPKYGSGACYSGFCQSVAAQCTQKDPSKSWTACSTMSNDPCGTLQCNSDTTGCVVFPAGNTASGNAKVADGVPCGTNKQCVRGVCTVGSALNPRNLWRTSDWTPCSSCGETQTRTASCSAVALNGNERTVDNSQCSPDSKPWLLQKCGNLTLNCRSSNPFSFGDDIATKYGALDKAAKLRSLIPRIYGPKEFDSSSSAYWNGIKLIGLFPLLIAILCLVWMGYHFSTGGGCGNTRPAPEGYETFDKVAPFVVLSGFSALTIVFCVLGLYYATNVNSGVKDTSLGVVNIINQFAVDSEAQTKLVTIPLQYIEDQGDKTLADTVLSLQLTVPAITSGIAQLNRTLLAAKNQLQPTFVVPGQSGGASETIVCPFCSQAISQLSVMTNTSTPYSNNNFDVLISTLNLLRTQISSSDSTSGFGKFRSTLDNLTTTVNSKVSSVKTYGTKVNTATSVMFPLTVILFLIPCFVLLLVAAGGFCKSPQMFVNASYLTWTVLLVMWVFLALYLPLAATFGDSCAFMNTLENNSSAVLGDGPVGTLFRACLANDSVLDAFGIADGMALFKSVQYPINGSTLPISSGSSLSSLQAAARSFSAGDNLLVQGSSVSLQTDITTLINQVNQQTGGSYSEANVGSAPPSAARSQALTLILAKQTGTNMVAGANNNLTAAVLLYNQILSNHSYLVRTLQDSNDGGMLALVQAAGNLDKNADCGFIGKNYAAFKKTWCETLSTGVSFLGFCCFMIGMFAGPMVFLELSMRKRLMPAGPPEEKEGGARSARRGPGGLVSRLSERMGAARNNHNNRAHPVDLEGNQRTNRNQRYEDGDG